MRLLVNYTKSTKTCIETDPFKSWKLQNSRQLQNNTVKSAMLIIINRMIKIVTSNSTKSVLIALGLTAAASAADAGIHKKILGSGNNGTVKVL